MAISREVLAKIPAFDPELGPGALGLGEETLFSMQLKEAGYRIAGAFEVEVEHHFDEKRLEAESRLEIARTLGAVDAYLAYHWKHAKWSRPRLRLLRAWILWALCRASGRKGKGVSERLLWVTRSVHACLQYLREEVRPRNYEKHGLARLRQESGR